MRPLHWATLDKRRPVLVLTREVMVGLRNGLLQPSAVKCDQITSIPIGQLHEPCGFLLDAQELALHEAIQAAFDLVEQAAFLAVAMTSSPALSAGPSATAAARQSLPA
jgi:mRNA interferase MazF